MLGAPIPGPNDTTIDNWDLNEQHSTSFRFARSGCTNTPGSGFFMVLTFKLFNNGLQVAFHWSIGKVYYRIAQDGWDWKSWHTVAIDA